MEIFDIISDKDNVFLMGYLAENEAPKSSISKFQVIGAFLTFAVVSTVAFLGYKSWKSNKEQQEKN